MEEEQPQLLRELIARISYDEARASSFKAEHTDWNLDKGALVVLFSDDTFLQISGLDDKLALRTLVDKMRHDETRVVAMVDLGPRLMKAISSVPASGYIYSPMTEQYYRPARLAPNNVNQDTDIRDRLICAYGIIAGQPIESARFAGMRMLNHQSGRCHSAQ